MPRSYAPLLLAMAHEIRAEAVDQIVSNKRDFGRDPYEDARLILRYLRVPAHRMERFIDRLREQALEMAYREIERRCPDPEYVALFPCPDCNASGVASYGYCRRCGATGYAVYQGVAQDD